MQSRDDSAREYHFTLPTETTHISRECPAGVIAELIRTCSLHDIGSEKFSKQSWFADCKRSAESPTMPWIIETTPLLQLIQNEDIKLDVDNNNDTEINQLINSIKKLFKTHLLSATEPSSDIQNNLVKLFSQATYTHIATKLLHGIVTHHLSRSTHALIKPQGNIILTADKSNGTILMQQIVKSPIRLQDTDSGEEISIPLTIKSSIRIDKNGVKLEDVCYSFTGKEDTLGIEKYAALASSNYPKTLSAFVENVAQKPLNKNQIAGFKNTLLQPLSIVAKKEDCQAVESVFDKIISLSTQRNSTKKLNSLIPVFQKVIQYVAQGKPASERADLQKTLSDFYCNDAAIQRGILRTNITDTQLIINKLSLALFDQSIKPATNKITSEAPPPAKAHKRP